MADRRCARCGRMRHLETVEEVDQRSINPFVGRPGPWATIDDQLVCFTCQTPEEQRDLARRIVDAIERQAAEVTAQGTDPPPPEPPLIAYAMELRERLGPIPSTPPPPRTQTKGYASQSR
jgi:hypothetical protein